MCGSACMCTHACVHVCVCLCPARLKAKVSAIYFSETSFQTLASLNFSRELWAACKTSRITSFLFIFYSFPFSFLPKITKKIMVLKNRDLKNNEGSRLDITSPWPEDWRGAVCLRGSTVLPET